MGSISFRSILGVSVLVLLVIVGFFYSQPKGVTPDIPTDPKALEALELVRMHPGRNSLTLEEAVDQYVRDLETHGTPHQKGVWQVAEEQPGVYAVRILVREKGSNEWIEREFAWRVTLKDKTIRVISLAANHFMPFHELPPLPHQDQISSKGSVEKDRQPPPSLRQTGQQRSLASHRHGRPVVVVSYDEYAPRSNGPAALLDGHFEQPLSRGTVLLLKSNLDSSIFYPQGKAGDRPIIHRVFQALAGTNIELPAMPWTAHRVPVKDAFA